MRISFDAASGKWSADGLFAASTLKPSKSGKVLQPDDYYRQEKFRALGHDVYVSVQVYAKPLK